MQVPTATYSEWCSEWKEEKLRVDVNESEIAAPCWHSLEFPIIFQLCLINDIDWRAVGYLSRRNQ